MSHPLEIKSMKAPDKVAYNASKPARFKYTNIKLILVLIPLVVYGLIIVYSAVVGKVNYNFNRQILGVAVGAILMILLWRFDYRVLSDYTALLLVVNVMLLLSPYVPFLGVEVNGSASWIKLFGIQLQPGEFAKVSMILLAASVVSRYGGKLDDPREYLKSLGILLIPFVCVVPYDFGTSFVYLVISAVALIMGGARMKHLLITLAVGIMIVAILFAVDDLLKSMTGEYKLLKQYQRSRLLVIFDQEYAHTDAGYNLSQAKIAIGSGGLFGKGLFNGSQSNLGYLPESPTDFIFCVLAEQLGFFGAMVLLSLYGALVAICLDIARQSKDLFGLVVVMCFIGMFLFQVLENIGMTCGLMPITGIPLPFMSYGTSFMMVNFVSLGLVGSVWVHANSK